MEDDAGLPEAVPRRDREDRDVRVQEALHQDDQSGLESGVKLTSRHNCS